jgi:hypothetical protein
MLREIVKVIIAIAAMIGLPACVPEGNVIGGPEVHVGVLLIEQTPEVDRIAAPSNANQYFMTFWDMYQRHEVTGAVATLEVFLQHNGESVYSRTIAVDGVAKFAVPLSAIEPDTGLCVRIPSEWIIIAHQKVAAHEGVNCTPDIYPYFASGRGRTAEDAYGVIAIKPAG